MNGVFIYDPIHAFRAPTVKAVTCRMSPSHQIPAIDRGIDVIEAIAASGRAPISDLSARLRIPRSTVYRLLNSLQARGVVTRDADGSYGLGPWLLRMARAVPAGPDLPTLARPVLERLADAVDNAAKLSVRDGDEALVVAVAPSPRGYGLNVQVGRRFPLHAGAASKMLLAHATDALPRRLARLTRQTISDRALLLAELAHIRAEGVAEDRGEFAEGICAIAAPVMDATGGCPAVVSVPFLAAEPAWRIREIRRAVIAAARELTAALGGGVPADQPAARSRNAL